ncbi:spindle assembly abnormal protein 6, putative [Plasmodium gallinaceum]|uniref:Spindle assembly abnormal protein 6, putative n=1 Tax=Plasmodium gallinaceum TaxID=5849 RepID=A0A1J1GMI4_PLAGA|nr:spindle assembly abnormal protein 6, putative [Plasmodium gallinaceum]CRG93656.1 spindle assembly abnormal protein 6, putative [Plasmodium gallinaceum]
MNISDEELNKRKKFYDMLKNNQTAHLKNSNISLNLNNNVESHFNNKLNSQLNEESLENYYNEKYKNINNIKSQVNMNTLHNFSDYSYSNGNNCEYINKNDKINHFVNMSNDNSIYISNLNNIDNNSPVNQGKNNYENKNNSHMDNISNNKTYDLINNTKHKTSSDIINTDKMNNSLKLYNNIDMSFIYNKYDKNGLIYCKKIKFHLKNERDNDYTNFLVVKINTLKSTSGKQYMRLELSDDKNESFFYYLDLFEENYEKIKREQKLVINFNLFPFKFIDLLEECVLECEQYEDIDDQRLNAVLIFENKTDNQNNNLSLNGENESTYNKLNNYNYYKNEKSKPVENAILNLVEINQFKELTHLSLVLKKADNENVIKYLCNNLKYIKEYNYEIIKKLNEEIINNNKNNMEIKNLENTIEKLENAMKTLKNDFSNALDNDINNLREKHLNEINNLKEEHQRIIEKKEEKFTIENDELKKDLENFKNKFKDLNELNENNEKQIFNLNSKVKTMKNELEEKNINFLKLVKEKENIENEKNELEKYKNTFTIEFNNLKSKYEKECESNISNNSSYENIKINNSTLESELKKHKERNAKLEKEINIAIDEINKGNDIITKLQNQLKKMKDKLKTKTLEHVNIEKTTSQSINEINKLQNDLKNLQIKLNEKCSSEENLKREVDNLKRKNEEIIKELNISREVNLRLNKEITNKSLDQYATKIGNLGTPNGLSRVNLPIDTNLLDKDLFTKLKANLKNSTIPTYASENNMNNLNLITGKIASLDINDRYNKPVKFIPPGI